MKYQKGEQALILDVQTNRPSGTAKIIDFNEATELYKVKYKYYNSEKEEETEVPEHRLITHIDIINSVR